MPSERDDRPDRPGAEPLEDTTLPPLTPPEITSPSLFARAGRFVIDVGPLRASRQFRLLWTAESVSDVGVHITDVAVAFQVFQITHSPLAVGLIGLCQLVPLLVLSVVGGTIADRVDRRRFLRGSFALFPLLPAALAANALLPNPHLWVLYGIATLTGGFYALVDPAIRSAPPLFFAREELPAVFALSSISHSFGALFGPAVGGVLIAAIGLPATFAIDAVAEVVALTAVVRMGPIPRVDGEHGPGFLQSLREGLRFLKGKPVLQSTFTFDLNAMIFGFPTALFPAMAQRIGGGARTVGFLYAAPYAGALLITIFSGRAKHVRRQGLAVMLSIVAWGAFLVGFGLTTSLWVALVMLAAAGTADMWSGIFRTSIAQTVVPDEMRGRLSGIELTVVASGPALGDIEAGTVASLVSVPFAIVSGGLACVAGVGILGALVPQFARYDAR
ncbi:MAG TPA: MFS transporter, partial [Actinomycetota bacterium]|nr:MFS transporter [Actinomycetota bacterium]